MYSYYIISYTISYMLCSFATFFCCSIILKESIITFCGFLGIFSYLDIQSNDHYRLLTLCKANLVNSLYDCKTKILVYLSHKASVIVFNLLLFCFESFRCYIHYIQHCLTAKLYPTLLG